MMCCGRSLSRAVRSVPEQVFVRAKDSVQNTVKIGIGKNQIAYIGPGLPVICIAKSAALANQAFLEILGPCSTLQPAA